VADEAVLNIVRTKKKKSPKKIFKKNKMKRTSKLVKESFRSNSRALIKYLEEKPFPLGFKFLSRRLLEKWVEVGE
jgi:hypothetical protein